MNKKIAYFFLLPAGILFVMFSIVPALYVCYLSFFKTNFVLSEYIGLDHYRKVLLDVDFWAVVGNTFIFVGIITTSQIILALIVALTVVDMKKPIQDLTRFVVYVPILSSGIIIGGVWRWIFSARSGLANWLLSFLQVEPVLWLGQKWSGMMAISIMMILTYSGFYVMVFLSFLMSVPEELRDAAIIDGASTFQYKTQILFPLIIPVVISMTMIGALGIFQMWETIYIMTGGGPVRQTSTLMYDIYETGFLGSRTGEASMKTVILLVISSSVALIRRFYGRTNDSIS